MALARLGAARISSISDSNPNAVLAAELWPNVRDGVLRDHEWSVAIGRRQLAAVADENLTPYDYGYQLPADPYCLRVLNLIDLESTTYTNLRPEAVPYEIEGRVLWTDVSPCGIRYIKRVEDVSDYDPLLVDAMSLRLAASMAFKVTQSGEIEMKMLNLYSAVLLRAQGWNAEEKWEGYPETTDWSQVGIRGTLPSDYFEDPYRRSGM